MRPRPPTTLKLITGWLRREFGGAELKKETGSGKWLKRLTAYGYVNPEEGAKGAFRRDSSDDNEKVESELSTHEKAPKEKDVGHRRR